MRLDLNPHWTGRLLELPESGMGYQRVRIRLKNGRTIPRALVFNAEVLQVEEAVPPFRSEDIADIEIEPGS